MNFSSCPVIATTTWRGLCYQKALLLLLVFAFFLLASGKLLTHVSFQEELQLFQDGSLGMLSFSLSIIAIVATASIFPGAESPPGLVIALSKSLPRYQYLLGKLVGIFLFLMTAAFLMGVLFFLLLFLREQSLLKTIHDSCSPGSAQKLTLALLGAQAKIGYGRLLKMIFLALMQSWVMASLTLVIATIGNSMLFTIMIGVASYAVSHLKGVIREVPISADVLNAWSHQVLVAVTVIFPDLSIFDVSDCAGAATAMPTRLVMHAVGLGFVSILCYFLVASVFFQRRDF